MVAWNGGENMPRKKKKPVKDGAELVELWREFCAQIVEDGYTITPTVTEFIRFIARLRGAEETAVAGAVEALFPDARAAIERIRADVVSQGTMLGKYQSTMSVLAIKNWCGWADKQDPARGKTPAGIAEAAAEIERLMADDG